MAMEKIRKLVLFYLDVFVFIFKATSLSVFYTVKCHHYRGKMWNFTYKEPKIFEQEILIGIN